MPLHWAIAPGLRHRRVDGHFVTSDAIGEPAQVRVRGLLTSCQPLAQGPGRPLTDQLGEPIRQVHRGPSQLTALGADRIESCL